MSATDEQLQHHAPTHEQHYALYEELFTSIKLIEEGLGQVQRIDFANNFYHLPTLLLASGFERLMKIVICLHTFRDTGKYPTRNIFPKGKQGHDLVWLLHKITEECFEEDYLNRIPVARKDFDYLCTDTRFLKLVDLLSIFGQDERYYNLNIVLSDEPRMSSPDQIWNQIEMSLLKEDEDWLDKLKVAAPSSDIWNQLDKKITTELVILLERFARALARLFTIDGLGDQAKRYTGTIAPFLFLRDDELGNKDYNCEKI